MTGSSVKFLYRSCCLFDPILQSTLYLVSNCLHFAHLQDFADSRAEERKDCTYTVQLEYSISRTKSTSRLAIFLANEQPSLQLKRDSSFAFDDFQFKQQSKSHNCVWRCKSIGSILIFFISIRNWSLSLLTTLSLVHIQRWTRAFALCNFRSDG